LAAAFYPHKDTKKHLNMLLSAHQLHIYFASHTLKKASTSVILTLFNTPSVNFNFKCMKQLTSFLFFVCWAMFANAQSTSLLTQSVFFATDSHQLSPNEVQNLDVLVPQLDTYADYSIEIKAHTDNRGSNGYNQQLSERRADAVYQYLVQKGIKSTKTNSTALGENEPLYNNADAEGQQKNRRVDVLITTYLFDSLEQLLKRATQDNLQTFYIEPAQNCTITARNGTTIAIAAGSLTYPDGTIPTSTITLQLREALSTADILLENLHTVSNGQILETGGMVYLAAQANGKNLEVKSGSNLQISLPTTKVQNGMELFYGKQNANKTINWEPANVSFTQKTTPQNDALPPINFDF
jgi:outer membrane protein OmpA-like peptidoglycan-associated protein